MKHDISFESVVVAAVQAIEFVSLPKCPLVTFTYEVFTQGRATAADHI